MQYYVIDGSQSFGPASLSDLQKWRMEGRILPHMQIRDENGQIYAATSLLYFPPDATRNSEPAVPPVAGPAYSTSAREGGSAEFVWSIVLLILSWFCCPVIGTILALVLAYKAKQLGHKYTIFVIVLGWVTLAIISIALLVRLSDPSG